MNLCFFSIASDFSTFHRRNEIESFADQNRDLKIVYFTSIRFLFSYFMKRILGKERALDKATKNNIKIHNLFSLLPLRLATKSKTLMYITVVLPIKLQVYFSKRKYGMDGETYTWFYKPDQYIYLSELGPYIYLHYDNYKADKTYSFSHSPNFDLIVKKCIEESEMSLICSARLFRDYKRYTADKVIYYPNAISNTLDLKKQDISRLRNNKVIGFVGQVDKTFDSELLEEIAVNFPQYELRLIGGVKNDNVLELSRQYKNINLIGYIDYNDLSSYIDEFSIGICPYIINEFNSYRNPLKIVEYFSRGLPVVTVPCDISDSISELVTLAEDKAHFISGIKNELEKNDQYKVDRRQELARKNRWDSRVKLVLENINR
ncbi:glycosyltransferase [Vibrio viridaestus]|uniref:Glycosyltransferase n=1 Tax=Vibrio viridaestus TaxID=2487322 RepID=A0A3N9U6Y7_9VIBR|nr:glycosyltransferase [Vibrio viridaestus]RQW63876.1 glycosyltransferase [Vibrio viridaestus]